MKFKKEEMSLYNGPDAHIGEKTRRRKSQFQRGEDSDDSQNRRDMRLFDMAENHLDPKGNKYHLFTDRKGKELFMDKIKDKISKEGF